jgi:hypothetical protein
VNLHGVWVLILSKDDISAEVDCLDEHYDFVDTEINEFIQQREAGVSLLCDGTLLISLADASSSLTSLRFELCQCPGVNYAFINHFACPVIIIVWYDAPLWNLVFKHNECIS